MPHPDRLTPHRLAAHRPTLGRVGVRRFAALVATAGLVVAGCADDSAGTATPDGAAVDGELPAPEVTAFTTGEFDAIELPRGAQEAGQKTERDGAISQSFFVSATSPQEVMDAFTNSLELDGWELLEPVAPEGTDSYSAAWAKDGRRLEISAVLAQGVEDERTQFSVVLLPSLEPGTGVEGG